MENSCNPSGSIANPTLHDTDKAKFSNPNSNNTIENNNENEDVRHKGRFTFKVKKQPSPSNSIDKIEKINMSNENFVPQISSSPLSDSPKPLFNSSSSVAPREDINADALDEEEARLQEMVDQLTLKVDSLIEEGKEIKQDIVKILKTVQVLTTSQNKH